MRDHWQASHLSADSQAYLDQLYDTYLTNPARLSDYWRAYFDDFVNQEDARGRDQTNGREQTNGGYALHDVPHSEIIDEFKKYAERPLGARGQVGLQESLRLARQGKVAELINAYRTSGHEAAKLDPLGQAEHTFAADLQLNYYSLGESDLDEYFNVSDTFFPRDRMSLRELMDALNTTYCGSIGLEFMHMPELEQRRWLQSFFESRLSRPGLDAEQRVHLLKRLTAAEGLEKYLGNRYPGAKRFGLEGCESLVPLVEDVIQMAGGVLGVKEVVIGMAHRGRLNLLVNILGKKPGELFGEFEDRHHVKGSGDVKYHQGFSSNVMTPGGELHLAMVFNPSHLEIVNPVVIGSVRARQDRRGDKLGEKVLPILIHGDAAFAGQGVVMETFQMSGLRGYKTGGSLHVIVNNQVGFTISDPRDSRSTQYCTDIAKVVNAPIFHVNADDPEAVMLVTKAAIEFKKAFSKDVVIDLVCYRRRGHNEADDPWVTQPRMYTAIAALETTRTRYSKKLIQEGVVDPEADGAMVNDYREALSNDQQVALSVVTEPNRALFVDWTPYLDQPWSDACDTSLPLDRLSKIGLKINSITDGVTLHKQVEKVFINRQKMVTGEVALDWGCAENLAYATILDDGFSVRMSGQDCRRGTFAHRHAVAHDQVTFAYYSPLRQLEKENQRFHIFDSFLSEEAVMAFEYGYAATSPTTLVIWEAQFGDFANGAQVVIDQFITSGEKKWDRLCGLTLLLPHGFEGAGPEHSSARFERFLQLCAEHNIQLCVPTTPAQIFHLLRRQIIRPLRKPLVVLTPKSLLRNKDATSNLSELAEHSFQPVINEALTEVIDHKKVERVIICSGKVYYDLVRHRREHQLYSSAVIRLEQIYPYPTELMSKILKGYPKAKTFVWCQEEPRNQGAWYNSQHWTIAALHKVKPGATLLFAGRPGSASPAVGSSTVHQQQQRDLVAQAFTATD